MKTSIVRNPNIIKIQRDYLTFIHYTSKACDNDNSRWINKWV